MDRVFYSESNIKEMAAENIDFILPLPFSVNIGKGLISETNKDIENPANAKRFGGDIFYVLESEVQIGEVNAYGYVLFNKKREGSETNSFYNRLIDIESALDGKEFEPDLRPLPPSPRAACRLSRSRARMSASSSVPPAAPLRARLLCQLGLPVGVIPKLVAFFSLPALQSHKAPSR